MVLARVGLGLQKISTGSFRAVIFHLRATFGPHLGRIWATFGPHLGRIWTFEAQKNTIFGIPNIICSKSIQKWLIIWERAYIFLNHGSNFLNLGHSGQENITSGYFGPSKMWPGLGQATQKAWPTGQFSGRALARPSPTNQCLQMQCSELLQSTHIKGTHRFTVGKLRF